MEPTLQTTATLSPLPLPGVMSPITGMFKLVGKKLLGIVLLTLVPVAFLILAQIVSGLSVFLAGVVMALYFVSSLLYGYALMDLFLTDRANSEALKSYMVAMRKFFSAFWLSILVGLVSLAGFLFLIVPGIFLSVVLAFAGVVFFAEGIRGREALIKSWQYVEGRWWSVCVRFLLLLLIAIVAVFILAGIVALIFGTAGFSEENVTNITDILNTFVGTPFIMAFIVVLYGQLKGTKVDQPVGKKKQVITIMAWAGAIIIPLLIFGAVTLVGLDAAREKALNDGTGDGFNPLEISY